MCGLVVEDLPGMSLAGSLVPQEKKNALCEKTAGRGQEGHLLLAALIFEGSRQDLALLSCLVLKEQQLQHLCHCHSHYAGTFCESIGPLRRIPKFLNAILKGVCVTKLGRGPQVAEKSVDVYRKRNKSTKIVTHPSQWLETLQP